MCPSLSAYEYGIIVAYMKGFSEYCKEDWCFPYFHFRDIRVFVMQMSKVMMS